MQKIIEKIVYIKSNDSYSQTIVNFLNRNRKYQYNTKIINYDNLSNTDKDKIMLTLNPHGVYNMPALLVRHDEGCDDVIFGLKKIMNKLIGAYQEEFNGKKV